MNIFAFLSRKTISRKTNVRSRNSKPLPRRRWVRQTRRGALGYGSLEPRQMLAFTGMVSGTTTILTQTADDGPVAIFNNGAANSWLVLDGSGPSLFAKADNVEINLLNGTSTVQLYLENAHPGDVLVRLNDGDREFRLDGSNNSIGGNLRIDGGSGNQAIELTGNAALSVSGDLTLSLQEGYDRVYPNANDVSIGGALRMYGTNRMEFDAPTQVNGFLIIDTSMETVITEFATYDQFAVGGGFTYVGGDAPDGIYHTPIANLPFEVAGPINIDFGLSVQPAPQRFMVRYADFGSSLKVVSSNASQDDEVIVGDGDGGSSVFSGDIWIDLGDGVNDVVLRGTMNGAKMDYRGGTGVDDVEYNLFGAPADVNIVTGGGADDAVGVSKFLDQPVAVGKLRVDYVTDSITDQLFSLFSDRKFDITLLNYRGFDVFQSVALDQVNVVEKVDLGTIGIEVQNNGALAFDRNMLGATGMAAMSNLRLTTLSQSQDITVKMDQPLAGFLIMNVRQGDRQIDFLPSTMPEMRVGGLVRIDAAAGSQGISVNTPLIADRLAINLRGDADQVTFTSMTNGSRFSEMVFRGVDNIIQQLGSGIQVYGNVVVNSRFFVESSYFEAGENFDVVGKFTYLGGDGDDTIIYQASELGEMYVDLGDNTTAMSQGIVLSGVDVGAFPGSTGRLTIKGGNSQINSLGIDSTSSIRGFTMVDFRSNTAGGNLFHAQGNYWDRIVYHGGANADNILLENMPSPGFKDDAYFYTGDGADSVELANTAKFASLLIDFGDDDDAWIDGYGGLYPFTVDIFNLP